MSAESAACSGPACAGSRGTSAAVVGWLQLPLWQTCIATTLFICVLLTLRRPPFCPFHQPGLNAKVAELEKQLAEQKKALEAAAASKLGEAEAAYSGKIAEVQQLLAEYQGQVGVGGVGLG